MAARSKTELAMMYFLDRRSFTVEDIRGKMPPSKLLRLIEQLSWNNSQT